MIKKFWPFLVLTLILLSWVIYALTFGVERVRNSCREEKAIFFSGKVKDIVQDSLNPPVDKIVFSDGRVYEYKYIYGLWIHLNKGDSVVKKANTLQYLIYRDSDTMQVDTFYRNEDCDKIKFNLWW